MNTILETKALLSKKIIELERDKVTNIDSVHKQ